LKIPRVFQLEERDLKLLTSTRISIVSLLVGVVLQFAGYLKYPKADGSWFGPIATDLAIDVNNLQEAVRIAGILSRLGMLALAISFGALVFTAFIRLTNSKKIHVNVDGTGHTVVVTSDGLSQFVANSSQVTQQFVPPNDELTEAVENLRLELEKVSFKGVKIARSAASQISGEVSNGNNAKNIAPLLKEILDIARSAGAAGKSVIDLAIALRNLL
jgi:hypothetical protein